MLRVIVGGLSAGLLAGLATFVPMVRSLDGDQRRWLANH